MPKYRPAASNGTQMYAPIANTRSIIVYGPSSFIG